MKVSELKEILSHLPDEMEVCIYADHGQDICKVFSQGTSHIVAGELPLEEIDPDDVEGYEPGELEQILVLEG